MIIFHFRFRPSLLMTSLTVFGIILFMSLGMWQLDRAAYKQAIETKFESRLTGEFHIFNSLDSAVDIEFQKLIMHGAYDNEHSILVDNQINRGRAGYYVLTPFKLSASDRIVLVNRGWVEVGSSRQQLPIIKLPAVDGSIRGIASLPALPGYSMGEVSLQDKWPQVVPYIEIEAMQDRFQNSLLPMVLWLDPGQAGHYVREWNPVWMIPEKSRAYAWQWFAFAATSLILYLGLNLSRNNDNG